MTMAISSISGLTPPALRDTTSGVADALPGFGEALGRVVNAVESTGAEANEAVAGMVKGTRDVHDAMIALQRADLTLQFSVQIRNKLVQAYQDIMRMPV
jgi:flagellar hook-basal body complex protein FliE